MVDPTQAPHLKPYTAPGAQRGKRLLWILASLWLLVAGFCVHLILDVATQQAQLSTAISWWRRAAPYHREILRVGEVVQDSTEEGAAFVETFPAELRREIQTGSIRYAIPLAGASAKDTVMQWAEAETAMAAGLASLAEADHGDPTLLIPPASMAAAAMASVMRDVTHEMTVHATALDGARFWLYIVAGLSVLGAGGLILLQRATVKRQRALAASQEALSVSEARYRNMFQENRTVQLVIHPGTRRIIDVNRSACAFYGGSYEQLTSMRMTDLLDRTRGVAGVDQRQDAEGRNLVERHRILTGGVRHVEVHTSPFEGHGRQLLYAIVQDIEEQVQAEAARREMEDRLAATVHSMTDAVFSVDGEGTVTLVNQASVELTGFPVEKLIGQPLTRVYQVMDERTRASQAARLESLPRASERQTPPFSMRLTQRTGGERIVSEASAPLVDAEGHAHGAVVVVRDITEQRKLEAEMLRSQKIDSLGVLAGGIAHDFNNILTGVFGHLSMARLRMQKDPEDADRRVAKAEVACHRARDLTSRLQTFAKGGSPIKRTASLEELVRETVEFALRGASVDHAIHIADDLMPAPVDKGQINQVLHNLVINANQAMPEGGALTVRAENALVDADAGIALAPGVYVRIDVTDTGTGITPDHLDRIFDPYFTTKETGTGLGLASSFSIIHNHGGLLAVRSEVGAGTTFSIYLPATTDAVEEEESQASPVAAPLRDGARILLMDDDVEVLEVTGGQLATLGYDVATSHDADEALAHYKTSAEGGDPYDLVILDLTVPGGRGGLEALDALSEFDPTVRAVLCTGYANHPAMRRPDRFGFCGSLPKPYTRDELTRMLSEVLDAA